MIAEHDDGKFPPDSLDLKTHTIEYHQYNSDAFKFASDMT